MGLRLKKDGSAEGKLTRKNMSSKVGLVTLGMAVVAELNAEEQVTLILDKGGEVRVVDRKQVSIRKPTPEELIEAAVAQGKEEDEILGMLEELEAMPDDPRGWTL